MNKIYGVDISHHNDEVDLHELVAAGGLSFIILKASEGKWEDPKFAERAKRIIEYLPNTLLSAYPFLRTDSPAPDQMDFFYEVLDKVGYWQAANTFAPGIDAERGLQGQEPSTQMVVDSIAHLEKLSGSKPGLYSGAAYWAQYFANVDAAYDWVARYGSLPPGIGFDIWQDDDKRIIAGHAYDHNVFYGTLDEFKEKVGR